MQAQLRHTFPTGSIIPANGVLVLFGGGNPSGDFGNSVVQTASEGSKHEQCRRSNNNV